MEGTSVQTPRKNRHYHTHRMVAEPFLSQQGRQRSLPNGAPARSHASSAVSAWRQRLSSRLLCLAVAVVSAILLAEVLLFRLVYLRVASGQLVIGSSGTRGTSRSMMSHIGLERRQQRQLVAGPYTVAQVPHRSEMVVVHKQQHAQDVERERAYAQQQPQQHAAQKQQEPNFNLVLQQDDQRESDAMAYAFLRGHAREFDQQQRRRQQQHEQQQQPGQQQQQQQQQQGLSQAGHYAQLPAHQAQAHAQHTGAATQGQAGEPGSSRRAASSTQAQPHDAPHSAEGAAAIATGPIISTSSRAIRSRSRTQPWPKQRMFSSLKDDQALQYGGSQGRAGSSPDMRYPGLPADFDPHAYMDYSPDLTQGWRQATNDSTSLEHMAKEHYIKLGFREPRVYKRLPLAMRYTACGGLMNQHYSHLAALTIALEIGADVILPYALKRDSFSNYFNTDPSKNRVLWGPAPFSSLWDIVHVQHFLSSRGLSVSLAPADAPVPNLLWPQQAFQQYSLPGFAPDQFVFVSDVYLASKPLQQLVKQIVAKAVFRAGVLAEPQALYSKRFPSIILELPCTLFSITTPQLPAASLVARDFSFSPTIQLLANKVISQMSQEFGQGSAFNGIHLRIEKDARDWVAILGGRTSFWGMYIGEVIKAKFSTQVPVYMAAGILSYNDQEQMLEATSKLAPYSRAVVFKEKYLSKADLEGLHPEQLALIDFLVLCQSRHFVGISVSTFSVFIREYRHLHRLAPRNTTFMVYAKVVGTEPLFNRAAVFD